MTEEKTSGIESKVKEFKINKLRKEIEEEKENKISDIALKILCYVFLTTLVTLPFYRVSCNNNYVENPSLKNSTFQLDEPKRTNVYFDNSSLVDSVKSK